MTTDNNKEIIEKVEDRKAKEAKALKADIKVTDKVDNDFVRACFMSNERGDGMLFAALHRDEFLYNVTSDQWFIWTGHHWEIDIMHKAHDCAENVARRYLLMSETFKDVIKKAKKDENEKLLEELKKQRSQYYKRAGKLRTIKGVSNCLNYSYRIENGPGIIGEKFDCKPWLLACKNGVVNLNTGEVKDGERDEHLTKATPHNFEGMDSPCPVWEQFLDDIFLGKKDLISYVQRLFGYGITGYNSEHILPILHGAGRNGKGTLVETLRYVLGSVAQPIESEMLLDQRSSRSSAGPSPDIMSLKGLRIAFANETEKGRRFATSKVKWLTGGDTLTGRNPHDKYATNFEPTHLLCLLTNHLPHVSGDEYAFWQRVHLIPFDKKFVDNPDGKNEVKKDGNLKEKLKTEAPGILAWLIDGAIDYQKQGLNPPDEVLKATDEYQSEEDYIQQFIDSDFLPKNETESDSKEKLIDVYKAFTDWYEENFKSKWHPSKNDVTKAIVNKGYEKKKIGGSMFFVDVKLKVHESNF